MLEGIDPKETNCVLRLVEMEQAKGSTASVASPTVTRPTGADTLQGFAEMINGVQMMVDPAGAVAPRSTQGSFCPRASESVFGVFKTCVYRCPDGRVTVGEATEAVEPLACSISTSRRTQLVSLGSIPSSMPSATALAALRAAADYHQSFSRKWSRIVSVGLTLRVSRRICIA